MYTHKVLSASLVSCPSAHYTTSSEWTPTNFMPDSILFHVHISLLLQLTGGGDFLQSYNEERNLDFFMYVGGS